jgi:hypothetical protein
MAEPRSTDGEFFSNFVLGFAIGASYSHKVWLKAPVFSLLPAIPRCLIFTWCEIPMYTELTYEIEERR